MNDSNPKSDDRKLTDLLREARAASSLPPRFQEGVWRRIENGGRDKTADAFPWLETVLRRVLRPRLALATVATLVLLGAVLGVVDGAETARQAAQSRYLEAVAHSILR
jgi:hypothetical protein